MKLFLQFVCFNVFLIISSLAACNRRPQGSSGDRSPVDQNFQILIDGNPATYIPGQQYNISLSCTSGLKFISFTLVVESENILGPIGYDMMGHFEIIDIAETKFSTLCENMLENTNTNTKTRIDVAWVAPTNPESGCVLIKAAVLQHRNVWFIDDGFLTKRICPEEIDEVNSQTPPVNPCCACDEAKYEIILERKWSRNTHTKDFPSESWRTRFSEIIGASHTFDYHFWEYGSRASQGLQEMAEHGSTRTLEAEIKANTNTGSIRTIIKAPGIAYRNKAMGTTLANVRVDPNHHVISLISKLDPSPDWIVGVAGLELCLMNCTWVDRKVLNLYPWDIGTDAGPSYMSPDQPQIPPDVVRRITSTYPSDARSPFYDETGAPMKPLATLYITRRKLYERDCEFTENVPLECATHPWNNWNECTSKCGSGTQYRVRAYKDPRVAESFNCQVALSQTQNCMGNQCGLHDDGSSRTPAAECELTPWSSWSSCSKRCGKGFVTRTRTYVYPHARDKCQSGVPIKLEQTKECVDEDCGGTIRTSYDIDDEMDQFENVDEPSLEEENIFDGNRYQMNRRPKMGRTNARNRNANVQMIEREDGQLGNRNYAMSNTNYRNPLVPRPNLTNMPNNEHSVPQENIYGNEQLIGEQPNRPFEQADANMFANANNRYAHNQPNEYTNQSPFDRQPQQTSTINPNYINRFRNIPTTERMPYNNFQNTRTPHNAISRTHTESDQSGIHEQYDEYGRKVVVVDSVDPNNYSVVQEYCWKKPIPKMECCKEKIRVGNYWFYDADGRQCKLFTTDNCDRSKNKFRSLNECENTCYKPHQMLEGNSVGTSNSWGAGFGQPQSQIRSGWTERTPTYNPRSRYTASTQSKYTAVEEFCFEKPTVASDCCKGVVQVSNYWFYDADDQQCKLFTTDNCDGNKNKFDTLQACEGTCSRPQQNLEDQQEGTGNSWGQPQSQKRPRWNGRRHQNQQTNNREWM